MNDYQWKSINISPNGNNASEAIIVDSVLAQKVTGRIAFRLSSSAIFVSKFDRKAIVITPTFSKLPTAIIRATNKQGYDNSNPKDCITGVTHKSKVYVIQDNVH